MHLAIKCASLIVQKNSNLPEHLLPKVIPSSLSTLLAFILLALDSFTLHIYFQHYTLPISSYKKNTFLSCSPLHCIKGHISGL
jgi:hypothetical protein